MIIHLKKSTPIDLINWLKEECYARILDRPSHIQAVTTKAFKEIPEFLESFVIAMWPFETDIQLASLEYCEKREVSIGSTIIGGTTNNIHLIAGPCSVESEEQIFQVAHKLVELGIKSLRAGSFKPRTSPYSYMGMGKEGLELLSKVRDETGLNIVSEVRDATNVDIVLEHADVIQIGTKSMYDHGILNACGASNKTILIKRGFGTTLQEFVQAAEFVLCAGNENVILCERGIRTFESKTRFTLDLCGVAYLKHHCNLPIIVDPSHALGHRFGIIDLAKASTAMGVDGLLIESHPNPTEALSDAAQQIDFKTLEILKFEIKNLSLALNLNLN